MWRRLSVLILCAAGVVLVVWVLGGIDSSKASHTASTATCRAELRSWVVLGRARHLYLIVECPPSVGPCSERVEFTSVLFRPDYRYRSDESGQPRLGRMIGRPLNPPPFSPPPDHRLEAVYALRADQAHALLRDRVFATPYSLVGANSNAGLKRVLADAGLDLPRHVLASSGPFGEFPGVEFDAGPDLPPEEFARFGLTPLESKAVPSE